MAAKESNPLVESSPLVVGIFYNPLSTLIPGIIPLLVNKSTNFTLSSDS